MMLCVTSVSYSISFQGSFIGPIVPKRGLRRGDPLSPYLFLLYVEALSLSLRDAADRAFNEKASSIKEILKSYELFSGQAVNYQKSDVFFSANVRREKQEENKRLLNITNDIGSSKYLGLPSLIGRSKKTVFRYLKDKIWKRIQGWSTKLLSKAGKAVLIRNVAQSIPSYIMSCFMIPKSLCLEIERMMNAFWWKSNSSDNKGIRWLAWERMSMSKKRGGLGFCDLHGFNLALLGKQCWNIIRNPGALVSRVLKAKYFPDCHLLQANRTGGASYTWSDIWEAKEVLKEGMRWVLGDGKEIKNFTDKWLRGKDNYCVDQENNDMVDECQYAILATRIPQNCTKDRMAWFHSSSGHYTVKSGYQRWHLNHIGDLGLQQSRGWDMIWRLDIPHKIKIFLWRFCLNNIPVRNLLRGKVIPAPAACDMCVGDVEHLMHLFCDCSFAAAY
ncbi:hypothetical protein AgCh_009077 [Apium graveolens]